MGNFILIIYSIGNLILLFSRLLFQTKYRTKIKADVKVIADQTSIVHFYFDSLGATKYERDKLFGTLDLIGKIFEI